MHRFIQVSFVIFLSSACGSTTATPAREPVTAPPPEPEPPPEVALESPPTQGAIARQDLVSVLDAGLGRFLQGVETEPALEDGRFVGFRLTRLFPGDEHVAAIDLQVGDVVMRVNGQPIERPEQALQVWDGLRVASELLIEYRRGDETRELRFEIVDSPEG